MMFVGSKCARGTVLFVTLACACGADGANPAQKPSAAPNAKCVLAEPPSIVLSTVAGDQAGAHGSYCGNARGSSCGGCADRGVGPQKMTIVHPGDELTITL